MQFDRQSVVRGVGLAIPIVIGLGAGQLLMPWIPRFGAMVQDMGVWAPVVFVTVYVLGIVLMMPVFLLIMVGGAVFGVVQGTLLAMVSALVGGTAAFLIGRHFARAQVARRVARHPLLSSIDRVIGEDGMKLVFLLRLSPAVPFVLSNYTLGVTRVRLRDFVLGTFGLVPIVAMYAAFGHAAGTVTADGRPEVSPAIMAAGVIVTVVLGLLLARIVQRAVREAERVQLTSATLSSATLSSATPSSVGDGSISRQFPEPSVHSHPHQL